MAAATVDQATPLIGGSVMDVTEIRLSSLTAGQLENVAHVGPAGVSASEVRCVVTTSPTSGDPVTWEWLRASDSTTNNTVAVKFRTTAAGDIAGAKVSVFVYFYNRAVNGLNPP